MAGEPSLPYNLHIAQSKTQTALSGIQTRVLDSFSYNNNRYTKTS